MIGAGDKLPCPSFIPEQQRCPGQQRQRHRQLAVWSSAIEQRLKACERGAGIACEQLPLGQHTVGIVQDMHIAPTPG